MSKDNPKEQNQKYCLSLQIWLVFQISHLNVYFIYYAIITKKKWVWKCLSCLYSNWSQSRFCRLDIEGILISLQSFPALLPKQNSLVWSLNIIAKLVFKCNFAISQNQIHRVKVRDFPGSKLSRERTTNSVPREIQNDAVHLGSTIRLSVQQPGELAEKAPPFISIYNFFCILNFKIRCISLLLYLGLFQ